MSTRAWVRNQKIAGCVAGRFEGEYEGRIQPLVVIPSSRSVAIVPEAGLIPVDQDDIQRQASLDLERVIAALREGGLDDAAIPQAWAQALATIEKIEWQSSSLLRLYPPSHRSGPELLAIGAAARFACIPSLCPGIRPMR